jgi:hypothetical protein
LEEVSPQEEDAAQGADAENDDQSAPPLPGDEKDAGVDQRAPDEDGAPDIPDQRIAADVGAESGIKDASDARAKDVVNDIVNDIVNDVVDAPNEASPMCRAKCGSPNCGTCPVDPMIKIHSPSDGRDSYIDATEVTTDEYAQFLAVHYDVALQSSECTWNITFQPTAASPVGAYPVAYVDWCDGAAYCKWANKRLCGLFGGAAAGLVNDAAQANLTDEWYNACTGAKGGTDLFSHRSYPYGDGYRATYCNVFAGMSQPPTIVGSMSTCQGGYAGLFDMAGNVSEWTNACEASTGSTDQCRERGGNHNDNGDYTRCDGPSSLPRNTTRSYVGIRCCAD